MDGWGGVRMMRCQREGRGGEASSDTWRRGRLMALKTSTTMQMTESRKERRDQRRIKGRETRERDAQATRDVVPVGRANPQPRWLSDCSAGADRSSGADWVGLIKHA